MGQDGLRKGVGKAQAELGSARSGTYSCLEPLRTAVAINREDSISQHTWTRHVSQRAATTCPSCVAVRCTVPPCRCLPPLCRSATGPLLGALPVCPPGSAGSKKATTCLRPAPLPFAYLYCYSTPVRAGRVEVSAQNHNFAVDPATLPAGVEVTHINLNDGTCAGASARAASACVIPRDEAIPHSLQFRWSGHYATGLWCGMG